MVFVPEANYPKPGFFNLMAHDFPGFLMHMEGYRKNRQGQELYPADGTTYRFIGSDDTCTG